MKVRPFHKMSKGEFDVWLTCPKTPYGSIINPQYAERPWRDAYIREWGRWLREHDREQWPDYMADFVESQRREKEKQVRKDGGRTESEGDVREPGVSGQGY